MKLFLLCSIHDCRNIFYTFPVSFSFLKYLSPFFVFSFSFWFGFVSILSVSPILYSYITHGEEGCPYSTCSDPCGSRQDRESGKDGIPCPAVLFGQFFLGQDHFFESLVYNELCSEIGYFISFFLWDFRNKYSYKARGPPHFT